MKKTIKINDLIFEKIKFRYDLFNSLSIHNRLRHNKILIDSLYPHALIKKIISQDYSFFENISRPNGYAISERVAADYGARKLHISELITMLGYTKTDITKLLAKVKNKELNIVLVGLGGTGANFLHWMYEMAQWTGKNNIFKRIEMYDDDDFDIPNMLRIPFLPQFNDSNSPSKINCIPIKFNVLGGRVYRYKEFFTEKILEDNLFNKKNTIFYGAPDIHTREWLSISPFTFIAATHRNSEFSLIENPEIDNDLMMETYGKINLSKFFLNHLTMTISFLIHLKNRVESFGTTEENRILTVNFDEQYRLQQEEGFKAGAKTLFVPDDSWVRIENLELPGENYE